ncbi:MAG: nuclear transport factor 2 family protein [Nitrosomonas sp.]|uniref:YybH family protein n=1 Tax=Nitrosomonas sp. TaxID=42353 RepID=UPI0025FF470D|nr:nuclear transport factor 2 family protein [Nitrosomonas sp.]MBY0473820.1 nuclear transport factor 2 family protein [Nitrosomonas sp.]
MNNHTDIQTLLEQWARSTRMGEQDRILNNHSESVIIYDVLPPMKYEGVEEYRKSWDEWQPETTGENIFDLHEVKITAGHDVAFAYGFIHCGGTLPDGKTFEDWVRATFCLEKLNGKWLITHQHISMPRG